MDSEIRPLKMSSKLPEFVGKHYQQILGERAAGKPVIWCPSKSPAALFRAMGFEVFLPEAYAGSCATMGIATGLCQQAEAVGYSPDLCSVIRNSLGIVFGKPDPETLPTGGLPKPDIVYCNPYCPPIIQLYSEASRFFDAPILVMERPRYYGELSDDEFRHFIDNCVEELQEMIVFLESFTGRPLNYDRLQETVALEQKTSRLWFDALEMCQNIPTPAAYFDIFMHLFPCYMWGGTPETVAYYEELNDELTDRVDRKFGAMVDEKYRLLWDNAPFLFGSEGVTHRLATHGAIPVASPTGFNFGSPGLSPERPLETIAESLLLFPTNRDIWWKIDQRTQMVNDYCLDGMLMQRTRACQAANMGQEDIMNVVIEKTGVPGMILESDNCDERLFFEADIYSKLDAFLEILERKGPRPRQRESV